jgi:hypothetical protein
MVPVVDPWAHAFVVVSSSATIVHKTTATA